MHSTWSLRTSDSVYWRGGGGLYVTLSAIVQCVLPANQARINDTPVQIFHKKNCTLFIKRQPAWLTTTLLHLSNKIKLFIQISTLTQNAKTTTVNCFSHLFIGNLRLFYDYDSTNASDFLLPVEIFSLEKLYYLKSSAKLWR